MRQHARAWFVAVAAVCATLLATQNAAAIELSTAHRIKVPASSASAAPATARVVNGTHSRHRNVGLVLVDEDGDYEADCMGTGTLVKSNAVPDVVLTAAHVAEDAYAMAIVFNYGEADESLYMATALEVDPRYRSGNAAHDMALFQLEATPALRPMSTNRKASWVQPKRRAMICGYGAIDAAFTVFPDSQRHAWVNVFSKRTAYKVTGCRLQPGEFAAGDMTKPIHDTGPGDSGGPLIRKCGGREILVGVTSYGPERSVGLGIYGNVAANRWLNGFGL